MQDSPNALFTELLGSLFGGGGTAEWGGISGTLANQTDLAAAIAAATAGWTYVRLGSDFTTSSATSVDVTGLAFTPVASAQYHVEAFLLTRSATGGGAAGVAPRPGFAWPTNVGDGVAFAQQASAFNSTTPRYGNTTNAFETGSTAIDDSTGSWPMFMWATFLTASNVSGDFKVQLRSETAATNVTLKTGSFIRYRRIA